MEGRGSLRSQGTRPREGAGEAERRAGSRVEEWPEFLHICYVGALSRAQDAPPSLCCVDRRKGRQGALWGQAVSGPPGWVLLVGAAAMGTPEPPAASPSASLSCFFSATLGPHVQWAAHCPQEGTCES